MDAACTYVKRASHSLSHDDGNTVLRNMAAAHVEAVDDGGSQALIENCDLESVLFCAALLGCVRPACPHKHTCAPRDARDALLCRAGHAASAKR